MLHYYDGTTGPINGDRGYKVTDSLQRSPMLLAKAVLEQGIREYDRFEGREEYLELYCGLAGVTAEDYRDLLDYFYGPKNKAEGDKHV